MRALRSVQHWSCYGALLVAFAVLGVNAPAAPAAGPPAIGEVWSSSVFSSSAVLRARINANESPTTYRIEYIREATYLANVKDGIEPFTGASRIPTTDANIGAGSAFIAVQQSLFTLPSDTVFRYRVIANNPLAPEPVISPTYKFATQAIVGAATLPDSRSWELVSPVEKNGGQVDPPGALAGGGVLQSSSDGGSITYGSSASFGSGAAGSPVASQYIATRNANGWSTRNITAPLYSGSFNVPDAGVPYQLFSADLSRALLLNGHHCRGEGSGCAIANPPIPGTDAPLGYQNYYLRDNASSAFRALLGGAEAGSLGIEPAEFELSLAGTSPDLRHGVVSTCARLTADAVEVPLGEGCDPNAQNLYAYSPSSGLKLVNLLPAATEGTPGAALGAQGMAVSSDGARIYWIGTSTGNLYLREGSATKQVDAVAGGQGVFQTASADGSIAYYTKDGHLYRYQSAASTSTDLTPGGGVLGVFGASLDGAVVYFLDGTGVRRYDGTTTTIAAAADSSNFPPTTGTARVSANGGQLLFVASDPITGYDNKNQKSGTLEPQVFLYEDSSDELSCVSCNPTFERPVGGSTIPGATSNGTIDGSTAVYKPRVLTAGGKRVFFESHDAIAASDTNGKVDVYQWEAQGIGSCVRPDGCVALISSGRGAKDSNFVDASASGDDVFFLTDRSLVSTDPPGAIDLYDARVGGGFPEPVPDLACEGDACVPLPPEPVDPTLGTTIKGPCCDPPRFIPIEKRCKKSKRKVKVKGKFRCVDKVQKTKKKVKAKKRPKRGNRGGRR